MIELVDAGSGKETRVIPVDDIQAVINELRCEIHTEQCKCGGCECLRIAIDKLKGVTNDNS